MEKELTVIIVNHNAEDHLLKTLECLMGNGRESEHEIIVVDNASTDESVPAVRRSYPSVIVLGMDRNIGFAKANNIGAEHASGRFLLILNSDTEIPEGALKKLIELKANHPEWGIVAPLVFNTDGSLQLSWGRDLHLHTELFLKYFAQKISRWSYKRKKGRIDRNVNWVSGACFLIERSLFRKMGGFDERFFLYSEDADLGKRIRGLGLEIHLTSEARIIHHEGKSVGRTPGRALLEAKKSQLNYYCKHNSRGSLALLKAYLHVRFLWKLGLSRVRKDKQGQIVCRRILNAIKEFRCENPV